MDPVDPLEPNLGCSHGDDPVCERGVHPGLLVVDAKVASHPMPMAVAAHSPCHRDAWLMEGCKTVRGLPTMALTDPEPAVEECCGRIVKDLPPTPQGLSDGAGGNH